MKRKYTTAMIRNGTNISFTVSYPIVDEGKLQKGTPWRWCDDYEKDVLCIIPFKGTREEALSRKKLVGDIVFLQEMRRKDGKNSQYKLYLPRWILEENHLESHYCIKIEWDFLNGIDVIGRIHLNQFCDSRKRRQVLQPWEDVNKTR